MPEVRENITAKQYIEMMRDLFKSSANPGKQVEYYDFLLAHGKEYQVEPLPETVVKTRDKFLKKFTPQMKRCYVNAATFALKCEAQGVQYCEGYGISMIPTEHAWNVIDGKLVDITWKPETRNDEELGGQTYFGIIVPQRKVFESSRVKDGMTILQTLYIQGWRGN